MKDKSDFISLENVHKINVTGIKKYFGKGKIEIPDVEFIFPKKYLIIGENVVGKNEHQDKFDKTYTILKGE